MRAIWICVGVLATPVYASGICEGEGTLDVQYQSFGTYSSKIKFWRKNGDVRVDTHIPTDLSLIFSPHQKKAKALLPSGPYSFHTTAQEWTSYVPRCLLLNQDCLDKDFKKSVEGPRYVPAEGLKLPCEWYEKHVSRTETYLCVYRKKSCVIPVAEFNFTDATQKKRKNLETSMRFILSSWSFKKISKDYFSIPKNYVSQGNFADFLKTINKGQAFSF